MTTIRRFVLDVLKPHDPSLTEVAGRVASLNAVSGVTATLIEIEDEVRTTRLAIEGVGLDLAEIEAAIADMGGSVHSVDQVSCGERIVDDGASVDG